MKKRAGFTVLAALMASPVLGGENVAVSGAWALYPLMVRWAEAYRTEHPDVRVDVTAGGAGKGMVDVLSGAADVAMLSREAQPAEMDRGALVVAVARDAVTPVVSAKNPSLAVLRERGVPRDRLIAVWRAETPPAWVDLVQGGSTRAVRPYTRSDSCGAAETWAKFLGAKQEDLHGTGVYGDPGLAEAVRKDPWGLGYNNVGFAFGPDGRPIAGLALLPIDFNGNGVLDPEERFFDAREDFLKAVSDGRCPSPPARDLYLVLRESGGRPAARELVRWILTTGQAWVEEAGYIRLPETRLQMEASRLP